LEGHSRSPAELGRKPTQAGSFDLESIAIGLSELFGPFAGETACVRHGIGAVRQLRAHI
jgi:hypothetical protein